MFVREFRMLRSPVAVTLREMARPVGLSRLSPRPDRIASIVSREDSRSVRRAASSAAAALRMRFALDVVLPGLEILRVALLLRRHQRRLLALLLRARRHDVP
jgi:hypothetical protein